MNRTAKLWSRWMVFAVAIGFSALATAQATEETKSETTTTTTKHKRTKKSKTAATEPDANADNTAKNKRDGSPGEPTADSQKNDKSDLDVTAEIRKSVVADKSLSTYAHNVKIIVQDGVVTLKGPVNSDAERTTIEHKAISAVGKAKVKNELEVKP